jgi:RNA polymerase sigma-70 factor (ECF subfamily)
MVAIEQLRGDPKAIAAMLSDSIVRIARTRDEVSFEVLFRYFAPRLKSYFLRQGSDHSLAEEITQEALVSVWRNAAQFDPSKASASTWIFTIARNLSIDQFRRTRRPTFDPTDPAFIPDGDQSPDYQLERAEADHRLREVMHTLSANEKSVLMLSFYEDCSHGDIAKKLDLPIGTVKSRIRLAFAKVRAALDARKGDAE